MFMGRLTNNPFLVIILLRTKLAISNPEKTFMGAGAILMEKGIKIIVH